MPLRLRTEAVIYRAENIRQACPGGCCGVDVRCGLSYFGQTCVVPADRRSPLPPERSAMEKRKKRHEDTAQNGGNALFHQALSETDENGEQVNEFQWKPVMVVMSPSRTKDVRWFATIAEALFIHYFRTLKPSCGYNRSWPPGRRRTIDPRQPRIPLPQLDKVARGHFHLLASADIPPKIKKRLARALGPGFALIPQ